MKVYLDYNRLSLNKPKYEFMLIDAHQVLANMPKRNVHITRTQNSDRTQTIIYLTHLEIQINHIINQTALHKCGQETPIKTKHIVASVEATLKIY